MTADQWGRDCGDGGVYCLVLWLSRSSRIALPRLAESRFDRGWYVYTGSAKRNLLPRLARHLRRRKPLHWNIDYLRAMASVRQIWVWPWTPGGECRTNRQIARRSDATIPSRGFGSSDCRCVAHLVSFSSEPSPPEHAAPFRYCVRGRQVVAGEPRAENRDPRANPDYS